METTSERKKFTSTFDLEHKMFYIKSENDDNVLCSIPCKINLQGSVNGNSKSVKTDLELINYKIDRLVNPYLNAENDFFKIKYSDKSIGYIFPVSVLENSNEDEFDEFLQAYKFYTIKFIIENFDFSTVSELQTLNFSDLYHDDSIYSIVCISLVKDTEFNLEMCLPSLALKGYYLFPLGTVPNVLSLAKECNNDLKALIDSKFLQIRSNQSITIQKAKTKIGQISLLSLLYKKLLVENDNPLFRFLILYQVIELLLEKKIREGIDLICLEKDNLNNFDFFQRMHEINNTRSMINNLFDEVTFDDKNEITNALKGFICQSFPKYSKQATGDCLYDVRNLLFHDFKTIIDIDSGAVLALVIQCEILIHQLNNTVEIQ